MENKKFDLEDRLVKFASMCLDVIANEKVQIAFKEANELMAIFLKSIETAKQNKIASTF